MNTALYRKAELVLMEWIQQKLIIRKLKAPVRCQQSTPCGQPHTATIMVK
jgi:hypothetical protein